MIDIAIAEKLVIAPMEEYDGNGYLCYVADGNEGNTGFGDTPADAFNSWQHGEDIAEAAWAKWYGPS